MPDEGIWVRTEPSVDGATYVVTLEFSEDRAMVLTPAVAMGYASGVLACAQAAEYDAAVFAQLRQRMDHQHAASVVVDLRKDRTPVPDGAMGPLRLHPGVNAEGRPFLRLDLDGRQIGQWTLADARSHALAVLEAVTAADLDAGYYRALVGIIGLDGARARNIVGDLANHREGV